MAVVLPAPLGLRGRRRVCGGCSGKVRASVGVEWACEGTGTRVVGCVHACAGVRERVRKLPHNRSAPRPQARGRPALQCARRSAGPSLTPGCPCTRPCQRQWSGPSRPPVARYRAQPTARERASFCRRAAAHRSRPLLLSCRLCCSSLGQAWAARLGPASQSLPRHARPHLWRRAIEWGEHLAEVRGGDGGHGVHGAAHEPPHARHLLLQQARERDTSVREAGWRGQQR